jgi:hypothetical protein
MKEHYDVLIATPGNSFTPGYVRSLLQTIFVLEKQKISWNFLNAGGSLIAMVREMTIAGQDVSNPSNQSPCSGQFTYNKIIWIDSDISWQTNDFFKLYESDKDIISGCYLMEDRTVPIYDKTRGEMMPEKSLLNFKNPFKVVGCGFGFLAVKTGVFENIKRPWFGPVAIKSEDSENSKEELILIGEDLSWCTKAINSGFDIWVDPEVRVTHQKTFSIFW